MHAQKMTLTLLAIAASAAIGQAQPIFETSFESSADPSGTNYTAGASVGGQGGWVVDSGTATVVSNPTVPPPAVPGISPNTNVVQQDASSSISRSVPENLGTTVLFRGFYFGPGVDELDLPTTTPPTAAALGFRRLSPTTLQIEGFNGTEFVAPTGVDPLASDQWHQILILLDYDTQQYTVSVNNTPYLANIPFSASVSKLNGFRSSTQVGTSLDTIGFFETDGDADDDGISDADEMAQAGANPLDGNLPPPPAPDADNDGRPDDCESTDDALLAVANTQLTHALLADSDGDGLLDGEESAAGCATQTTAALVETNPRLRDTDGDGFSDGFEVIVLGSDPLNPAVPNTNDPSWVDADGDGVPADIDPDDTTNDTDGDRYTDAYELQQGTNPNDSTSKPSLGDANGNGAITAVDVTVLKQVLQGQNPASARYNNLDTTLNGRLGATDVTRLKQYLIDPNRKIP